MKALIIGLLASIAVTQATAATLFIEVFDGVTLVSSTSSATGTATIKALNADFSSISVTAVGATLVPTPDLSSVAINVKSASAGSHTLTIDVFQTGVTASAGSRLESTFTTNDLIGDPGPTTETTFFNGTSIVLGTQLATHTFPVGETVGSFGPVITPIGSMLTADAHQYMVTFTAAGQSSNDTIQLSSTVPEPATWMMFMLGAAFIGWKTVKRQPDRLTSRYFLGGKDGAEQVV